MSSLGVRKAVALTLLSVIALSGSLPVMAEEKSPFQEGTGRSVLSADERAALLEYAENSRALLSEALEAAQGKGFDEANKIYLRAIKKVVVASYQSKPRSELILRIVLNQALELTLGVPTASGDGVQKAGVLAKSTNRELMTVILEDSIRLAMMYYQDDRKAIESGSLVNLPYMTVSAQRLALAQKWLASVIEWKFSYDFSRTALQQWMNTVMFSDNLSRTTFAEEVVKVDDVLKDIAEAGEPDGELLKQRVRFLRGVIRKQINGMYLKLKDVKRIVPDQDAPDTIAAVVDQGPLKVGDLALYGSSIVTIKAIYSNGQALAQYSSRSEDVLYISSLSKSVGCYSAAPKPICTGTRLLYGSSEGKAGLVFANGSVQMLYGSGSFDFYSAGGFYQEVRCGNSVCSGDEALYGSSPGRVTAVFSNGKDLKVRFRYASGSVDYLWESSVSKRIQ